MKENKAIKRKSGSWSLKCLVTIHDYDYISTWLQNNVFTILHVALFQYPPHQSLGSNDLFLPQSAATAHPPIYKQHKCDIT